VFDLSVPKLLALTVIALVYDGHRDPRGDACIEALPGRLGASLLARGAPAGPAAHPQVTETIKRTNRPCFGLEGCIPLRRGHRPRPRREHHQRPCSKTGRTVAIRYGEAVTAPALIAMFRQIIANTWVGGWRELKRQEDPWWPSSARSPVTGHGLPLFPGSGTSSSLRACCRGCNRGGARLPDEQEYGLLNP
jgi:hypothetical protein